MFKTLTHVNISPIVSSFLFSTFFSVFFLLLLNLKQFSSLWWTLPFYFTPFWPWRNSILGNHIYFWGRASQIKWLWFVSFLFSSNETGFHFSKVSIITLLVNVCMVKYIRLDVAVTPLDSLRCSSYRTPQILVGWDQLQSKYSVLPHTLACAMKLRHFEAHK